MPRARSTTCDCAIPGLPGALGAASHVLVSGPRCSQDHANPFRWYETMAKPSIANRGNRHWGSVARARLALPLALANGIGLRDSENAAFTWSRRPLTWRRNLHLLEACHAIGSVRPNRTTVLESYVQIMETKLL
jgi:hypothetical protein